MLFRCPVVDGVARLERPERVYRPSGKLASEGLLHGLTRVMS